MGKGDDKKQNKKRCNHYPMTLDIRTERRGQVIMKTIKFIMLTFVSINDSHALSPALNGMVSLSAILLLISNLFVFGLNQYNQRKNREHTDEQVEKYTERKILEIMRTIENRGESAERFLLSDRMLIFSRQIDGRFVVEMARKRARDWADGKTSSYHLKGQK